MKKIISLVLLGSLAVFTLCGCQGTTTTVSTSSSTNAEVKVDESRVYGLNESVTVNTGTQEYTIKITGIKKTTERNQFSDIDPEEVFIIDYEYQNISGDSLYISDMDFKIIDEESEIGGSYPISCTYPQDVTEGVKCKAQMALYINNPSGNITLQYFDNMFNSKPDVVFKISL